MAINLGNWKLDDSNGGSKPFVIPDSVILQPGEFRVFPKSLTKIQLNNSKDEARLFDFKGNLVANVSYDNPLEEVSSALDSDFEIRETEILTPNFANRFDTQKIKGVIRFVGEEGFVIKNESGEFFVKFGEENSALLARALLRKDEEWEILVRGEKDLTLKNFTVAPNLLRSNLLSLNSSPQPQNSAWVFALLVFIVTFSFLRSVRFRMFWEPTD